MSTIDGLFEQIIHSEKAAIKKKNLFQELRQAVFAANENGRKLEQTHIHLQETLKDKLEELSSKELTVKWLMSREQVYTEEKVRLDTNIKTLKQKQEELKELCESEKTSFCERVSTFCSQYGLETRGIEDRQKQLQDNLATLTTERDKLKKEVDGYKEQASSLQRLIGEKTSLAAQLRKLETETDRIVSNLCEELEKTTELEEVCQKVTHHPYTDPQFTSLQRQLEEEKAGSIRLDERSTQLQAELHKLHENLWKHQLQQRQQQKLQQQQQQQQQHMASEECSNEVLEKMFSDSEELSDPDLESKGQVRVTKGQGHSTDDIVSNNEVSRNTCTNEDVNEDEDCDTNEEDTCQGETNENEENSMGCGRNSVYKRVKNIDQSGSHKRKIFKRN